MFVCWLQQPVTPPFARRRERRPDSINDPASRGGAASPVRSSRRGRPPGSRFSRVDRATASGRLAPAARQRCYLPIVLDRLSLDRVAGERGAAAGPDPGNARQWHGAVGEQLSTVAEQGGRAAPADLAQPVGEDPGDRPERVRLAQAVGVTAGVLHLVGVRGPVDAAVGQPAGRQPGPAPRPSRRSACLRGRRLAAPARGRRPRRAARAARRARWRAPARARRRASPVPLRRRPPRRPGRRRRSGWAGGSTPFAGTGGCHLRSGAGRAAPTISRYSRAASSRRSSSPSGIQMTLRVELVERLRGPARRAPHATPRRSGSSIAGSRTP